MPPAADSPAPLTRLATTVPGLDRVLGGGLVRGTTYLVAGPPGAGKTILTNQVCFGHAQAGGRAVYVTLLAETNTRMLAQLQSLAFYSPTVLARTLHYFSAYKQLDTEGLGGLLTLLRAILRDQQATLLVLDGVLPARLKAESQLAYQEFLHNLSTAAEVLGCTLLLIAQTDHAYPQLEYTMMDGVLLLHDRLVGGRAVRELQVLKLRGSGFLRGLHGLTISDAGIRVFPRIETLYAAQVPGAPTGERLSLGGAQLDAMLGGGMRAGTATLVLGTPGSGKTLLGMQFLAAGAQQGEAGLMFGFFEPPDALVEAGERLGLQRTAFAEGGPIALQWESGLAASLDELAERLLGALDARGMRRLVIDGLAGFQAANVEPERLEGFLAALLTALRERGVTTLITAELRGWLGPAIEAPVGGLAPLVDGVLFLRHVELHSQLTRLISVLKLRASSYDSRIREFTISDAGLAVAASFASAEAVLTGIARPLGPPPAQP